jgi:hypothetical protein
MPDGWIIGADIPARLTASMWLFQQQVTFALDVNQF